MRSTPLNASTGFVRGLVYYLPKTVLDIDITLQLMDCRVEQRGTAFVFHFDVARQADVVVQTVADTAHGYVINYEELAAATKTTLATIELTKSSTLKSLNVDIKDQTATVISHTVGGAVKIASTISRVPLPTSTASEQAGLLEERYCGPVAKLALQQIRGLERAATSASGEEKLKLMEKAAAIRRAELTHRMFLRFDPQPDSNSRSVAAYPSQPTIEGWISTRGLAHLKEERPEIFIGPALGPLRTEVALDWPAAVDAARPGAADGIVYRQSVEAEVAVCAAQCGRGNGAVEVARSERVYSATHAFPQLGQLAVLPLRNGPFQDNVLKADWSDAGSIARLEFSNSASAEKASASILDTSGKIAQLVAGRRAAQTAAIAKAREDELADIGHRKAVLNALIELKRSQDAYDAATSP